MNSNGCLIIANLVSPNGEPEPLVVGRVPELTKNEGSILIRMLRLDAEASGFEPVPLVLVMERELKEKSPECYIRYSEMADELKAMVREAEDQDKDVPAQVSLARRALAFAEKIWASKELPQEGPHCRGRLRTACS